MSDNTGMSGETSTNWAATVGGALDKATKEDLEELAKRVKIFAWEFKMLKEANLYVHKENAIYGKLRATKYRERVGNVEYQRGDQ